MGHAVQDVMEDPMSRLLASRGMPLGMSIHMPTKGEPPADGPTDTASSSQAKQAPYSMEALDEILQTTLEASDGVAAEQGGPAGGGVAGGTSGKGDSWGTTREGAAEIARRIAGSNAESSDSFEAELKAAAEALHKPSSSGQNEPDDLQLSMDEAKYKTLESMSKDIKNLDEVFEVLASVPWLDEGDVDQRELKGMAQVSLLGTLEEVGFDIGDQIRRVWAGERDHSIVLEGKSAKDQAALISVLFHTKIIEDKHGAPDAAPSS